MADTNPTPPTIRAHLAAAWRILADRLRLQPYWWLGKPHHASIAPVPWGDGYALRIHRAEGVEWIDLPGTTKAAGHPGDAELNATTALLAARGLALVPPWGLDDEGNLTAPVRPITEGDPR